MYSKWIMYNLIEAIFGIDYFFIFMDPIATTHDMTTEKRTEIKKLNIFLNSLQKVKDDFIEALFTTKKSDMTVAQLQIIEQDKRYIMCNKHFQKFAESVFTSGKISNINIPKVKKRVMKRANL